MNLIQKIKCKLGFHSPKEIGRAIYPYDTSKTILAMGCRYCGEKLRDGYLINTECLSRAKIVPLVDFMDRQIKTERVNK